MAIVYERPHFHNLHFTQFGYWPTIPKFPYSKGLLFRRSAIRVSVRVRGKGKGEESECTE